MNQADRSRDMEPNRLETTQLPEHSIGWDDLIAEADLAEYWGVTERTLRNWRAAGRLQALFLPGGQVYYHPDDLLAAFSRTPPRGR